MNAEPEAMADDVTPEMLLEQANAAYAARKMAEARELYEVLIAFGLFLPWCFFSLGRIQRDAEDLEDALASFEQAIIYDSAFFWAHFERIDAMVRLRAPAAALGEALAMLADTKVPDLTPTHMERLEIAVMLAWDGGRQDDAVKALEALAEAKDLSELGLVRIVEKSRDAALRARTAARLMAMPPAQDFAYRVLGAYYQETGNAAMERRCMERLAEIAPNDFQAYFSLARAAAKSGDRAALAALRDSETRFTARQRAFVELVVKLEEEDATAALAAFRTLARLHDEAPLYPGIRLCYQLAGSGRGAMRDEVLAVLNVYHPDSTDVAMVSLNACIERQDFAAARTVFDTRLASITPRPMNVALAEIDILAHSQEIDRACALCDALVAAGSLTPQAFRMAARVYSEAGRHEDVVALGVTHIAGENVPEVLALLVRSARKAEGGLRRLLGALPPEETARNRAQQHIHEALVEDLAVAGDADILARLDGLALPPDRLARITSRLGRPAAGAGQDVNAVFYCTDATYLVPALVSIASAGLSNIDLIRRTPFVLLAESGETLDRAQAGARAIARRLAMSIEVVDAARVVTAADTLNASYGFFTGGQSLSLAAYYRIFLAEYLRRDGAFAKALYIDSDTAVRSGLGEVFALPSDKPLMARPELDRFEVRNAVRALGLQGTYFNSGVLRFDFRHPDIAECLAGSVRCATDPNAVRLFQDQCALNVGFQLRHDPLPEPFNSFHAPRLSAGEKDERRDSVIVHYIDRPKPWDSLYRRDAREWFGWHDLVRAFLDAGD
jgi:lipopolysaccharide biosynthesis glycosyltransferase